MKTLMKCSVQLMFLLVLTCLSGFAATDGGARINVRINDYVGSSSTAHYAVMWVTYENGTFIKSLRKQGPSNWGSSEWNSHCQVWNNARAGSTVLDGYSSATAANYTGTNSPVIWTWNCRDANNNLVPDGNYKFWVQYAENAGQGPHTTNGLLWVKGPNAGTTTYPNLGANFTEMRVDWTPIITPPTPPVITSVQMQGANLVLHGTGSPNRSYYVLVATNVNQSVATWARLTTNTFNASGQFSFTNAVSGPRRVYRLQSF